MVNSALLANLPDGRNAIPSPSEVENLPGLSHLARHFTQIDESWNTALLLGRDCMWAIRQQDYVNNDPLSPVAIKSCLGWSLVGPKSVSRIEKGKPETWCNHIATRKDLEDTTFQQHADVNLPGLSLQEKRMIQSVVPPMSIGK